MSDRDDYDLDLGPIFGIFLLIFLLQGKDIQARRLRRPRCGGEYFVGNVQIGLEVITT